MWPSSDSVSHRGNTTSSTGYYNTASGYQALHSNTTSSQNVADGSQALLLKHNRRLRHRQRLEALYSNTTGSGNVGPGESAGLTSDDSTLTGSSNTFPGYFSIAGTGSLNNATAIGALARVDESNALVLGSINGVNSKPRLQASRWGHQPQLSRRRSSQRGSDMVAASYGGNGDFAIDAPGVVNGRFVVRNTTGFVGIGDGNPTRILAIGQGAGHGIADGWDTYSSRWKTNSQTLHGALEKVQPLCGVSYDLKASAKHEVGVIAEEVGAVVPEVVSWEKNGKDAQGVDSSRITSLLIEATKEQQKLIEIQHGQIKGQQIQMRAQRAQITGRTMQVTAIQVSLKAEGQAGSQVRTPQAQMPMVHQ